MSSSSDPWNQPEMPVVVRKQQTPFKFLVPLIYAPVLPLIRLSLRRSPVLRDRLFTAVLAGAFIHGGYLVFLIWVVCSLAILLLWRDKTDLYDAESK